MPKRKTKVKDKWRDKKWITVEAPPYFGGVTIAYVPVTDPEKAIGRIIETTLYELTKVDPQHYQIKLHFQVEKIEGDKALTILKGQEYSREHLRSLIRRGSSMVSFVKDYETLDGHMVRVYVVAFTQSRINSSRKHAIRHAAARIVAGKAKRMGYDQFAQEVVYGKMGADILDAAKKIAQFRHVGVMKMKLVGVRAVKAEVVEQAAPAG